MREVPPWPQAIVFDLDGTLVDTVEDIATALNKTLADLELPSHPPEAIRTMVGGGLAKLLDRALAAHGVALEQQGRARAVERLLDHYAAEPAAQSRLYPDAAEVLRSLQEAGVARGLCTNKPDAIARDLLRRMGVAGLLDCIQGGELGLPPKPDPASLRHVLAGLGAEPSEAVMVGDSFIDLEAARAAGFGAVVLVSYGYSVTPVTELGADSVINHLHELVPALALLASRQ